ncbi:flotillin [Lactococcus hodotermopsidis]|uniref:Flotillin n=1 Tax=Pseudolactococcus hodotermopsidis TaxID=2709157 RepID=A0A6A0BBV4_9LACT|nr:SPFH domain-containing protein [Lactococcus hodotermopsidis]GFH41864.1 flotillin [Lactococcus hodotermopsidis]
MDTKVMTIIVAALVLFVFLIVLIASYKKAAPDEALIITGAALSGSSVEVNQETNSRVKIVKGGGVFVIPILQQATSMSLTTMKIDVTVSNTQSKTMVPVNVNATAILRVGSPKPMIAIASEKILGLSGEELREQLEEMVRGQIRTIVAEMEPIALVQDKQGFSESVLNNVVDQMGKFGLEVTGFTITNISDDNGFYSSTYKADIADKRREAANAIAIADFDMRKVAAENEEAAQEAEQKKAQHVSNFEKETAIIKAKNDKEAAESKAIAEQALALETAKAKKEVAVAEGDVAIIEQEKAAEVATKKVQVAEKEFEATIVTKQNAETKAIKSKAEADAQQIKAIGNAEAEAIQSKGLAEARVQTELAKAMEANGQAVLAQQIIALLPELAKALSEPLSNIDNMTVFNGTKGVTDNSVAGIAQTMAFVKSATGVDLNQIIDQRTSGLVTVSDKKVSASVEAENKAEEI